LARPTPRFLVSLEDACSALPRGLLFLAATPRTKRWLLPPLALSLLGLCAAAWWIAGVVHDWLAAVHDAPFAFEARWDWLAELPEGWSWLRSAWNGLVAALEWTIDALLALLASQALRWLGWFLLGSLATWFAFSIVYEACAGPFLDVVQERVEVRWFGPDARAEAQRGIARRLAYEARAAWASLLAAAFTLFLIVLALPLYLVPAVGYFLFAIVCGFATAVGLLDIPFTRRGWSLAQRARFLARNLIPLTVFGVAAGLLLAIPVCGALLLVPAASIGGQWLMCRLDKRALRRST
jgi:uncharacterized protein involved in cysteine biosynthesis